MKKNKLKRLITIPIYSVIILFLLFVIVLHTFFSDKVIQIFSVQFFLVSYTGSMEPELNYNDLIVVKKFDFDKLEKGDIITFYGKTTDGGLIKITHQIVDFYFDGQTGEKHLITKGINKERPDYDMVTIDGAHGTNKYIGKYVGKSEFFGNLFAYIKSPHGLVAISVSACCLTFIYIILKKSTKNKKAQQDDTNKI